MCLRHLHLHSAWFPNAMHCKNLHLQELEFLIFENVCTFAKFKAISFNRQSGPFRNQASTFGSEILDYCRSMNRSSDFPAFFLNCRFVFSISILAFWLLCYNFVSLHHLTFLCREEQRRCQDPCCLQGWDDQAWQIKGSKDKKITEQDKMVSWQ